MTMWKTIAKWLALAVVFLGLCWALVSFGSKLGRAEVQALWDSDKILQAKAIQAVKDDYEKREEGHRAENQRINTALGDAATQHALAIAAARAEFDQRLRTSEARAGYYQRQAQAGPAQCRSLASHAAELDRSLEEGRSLVRELRQTLGQRERELILLGAQITNDRKLFE